MLFVLSAESHITYVFNKQCSDTPPVSSVKFHKDLTPPALAVTYCKDQLLQK